MIKHNIREKKNKGFTLVELVIVVAILAILVGLLAPQYTKYVENARKAADASNMDEMVKAIETYAYDGSNQLLATEYTLTIGTDSGGTTTEGSSFNATGVLIESDGNQVVNDAGITKELNNQFPDWLHKLKTKSKKWGENGKPVPIKAIITVKPDGGIYVEYSPKKCAEYIGKPEYQQKR